MRTRLTNGFSAFPHQASAQWVVLGLIIALAAGLRFYKLNAWGFWEDEVFSIGYKEDGFNFNLWRASLAISLIHLATSWLGVSEWSARLVPAAIGVVTLPILYFPVRRGFGKGVALLFSSLLAVSTWHLYWSQNARFYTLLLLFYTLAMLSFYFSLEEDRPWFMLLALFFIGLAARESLVAAFFFLLTPLYLFFITVFRFETPPGLRVRNLAVFFSPALLLGLWFAGPYIRNWQGWLDNFGRINTNPAWILAGSIYYIGTATVLIGGFGAFYLLTQKNRAALLFGLGAVLPLLATSAVSLFQYAANRYVFVTLTSWILLAGLTLHELFASFSGRRKILALGVLALLLFGPLSENYLYYFHQNGNRADWRSAFEFIASQKSEGDIVVTSSPDVGNYYLGSSTRIYPGLDAALYHDGQSDIWFVEDLVVDGLYPRQLDWVQEHAVQVANFDVQASLRNFKMRVYFYDAGD